MASRRPLTMVNGVVSELPGGDRVVGAIPQLTIAARDDGGNVTETERLIVASDGKKATVDIWVPEQRWVLLMLAVNFAKDSGDTPRTTSICVRDGEDVWNTRIGRYWTTSSPAVADAVYGPLSITFPVLAPEGATTYGLFAKNSETSTTTVLGWSLAVLVLP